MDKLNQEIIAQNLGISPAFLSQIKNGTRHPRFHLAQKLADYFDSEILIWMDPSEVGKRKAAIQNLTKYGE